MDLNIIVAWNVLILSAIDVVRLLRLPAGFPRFGILVKEALIIATVLGGFAFFPQCNGLIGAGLWVGLVLPLLLLYPRVQKALFRRDYPSALRLSRIMRWIHPFNEGLSLCEYIHSLQLVQLGEVAAAEVIVDQLGRRRAPRAQSARGNFLSATGRHRELLEWVERDFPFKVLRNRPDISTRYILALGMTGQRNRMAREYAAFKTILARPAFSTFQNLCRLHLFALTGRAAIVGRILDGPLRALHLDVRRHWKVVTAWAAGETQAARVDLEDLAWSPLYDVKVAARNLLAAPPPELLQPDVVSFLDAEERETRETLDVVKSVLPWSGEHKPILTWTLMVTIGIAFFAQMALGSTDDLDKLYWMGAMLPPRWLNGQWWRLVTSLFLHAGPLHVLLNLYALFVVGPFVERTYGKMRFLLLYGASGIGSMFLGAALLKEAVALIGASGAIFGLLGSLASALWRRGRARQSPLSKHLLLSVCLVVCIQVAFDLMAPNSSFLAHMGGFVSGLVLSTLIAPSTQPRHG